MRYYKKNGDAFCNYQDGLSNSNQIDATRVDLYEHSIKPTEVLMKTNETRFHHMLATIV